MNLQFKIVSSIILNRQFRTDTDSEHALIRQSALDNGAFDAVISTHFSLGGKGAANLADAVINACKSEESKFNFLYDLKSSIEDKIFKISHEMYGAGKIEMSDTAKQTAKLYTEKVRKVIGLE